VCTAHWLVSSESSRTPRIERRTEGRRAGDPPSLISDNARIKAMLPWVPQYADLDTIVRHALQWERKLDDIRPRA